MFIPPTMLEIFAILYDQLNVAQYLPPDKKLNYKDHKSLTRHQQAYQEMTDLLLEYIAPNVKELNNYLTNTQRFFCTFNSAPYETELTKEGIISAYWTCIFGPMLANLLYRFYDESYEANAIHFIGKLLDTWMPDKSSKDSTKWAKDALKRQFNVKCPRFTQLINDIRDGSIQGRKVIDKNLTEFDTELKKYNLDEHDKIVSKVRATYYAIMIIRRLEKNGTSKYLVYVKNYLHQLLNCDDKTDLLKLHIKLCEVLFFNPNCLKLSSCIGQLIEQLDWYFSNEVKATYPYFWEDLIQPEIGIPITKPERMKLFIFLSTCPTKKKGLSPLSIALLDYYKMYNYVESNCLKRAYNYCLKVEKASNEVHLGQFAAINLIHKVVLFWMMQGKMLHNQFDSEITKIIMNLPSEEDTKPIMMLNQKFYKFYLSLNDNELMMLHIFKIFNEHHEGFQADPFKKLTEIINVVINICTNEKNKSVDLLPILKRKLDKNIVRTKSILPFSKRLSLSDSVDMILELYSLVSFSIPDTFYKFNKDERCKKLVVEFDQS